MEENQNNDQQGKDAKKVLANFDRNIKTITAVVSGNLVIPNKVPSDQFGEVIQGLFKEEKEAAAKNAKEALKKLLGGYATLQRTLAEERKKLDALEVAKKKEFNAEAAKVLNMFENLGNIEKEYYAAFQEIKDNNDSLEKNETEE